MQRHRPPPKKHVAGSGRRFPNHPAALDRFSAKVIGGVAWSFPSLQPNLLLNLAKYCLPQDLRTAWCGRTREILRTRELIHRQPFIRVGGQEVVANANEPTGECKHVLQISNLPCPKLRVGCAV